MATRRTRECTRFCRRRQQSFGRKLSSVHPAIGSGGSCETSVSKAQSVSFPCRGDPRWRAHDALVARVAHRRGHRRRGRRRGLPLGGAGDRSTRRALGGGRRTSAGRHRPRRCFLCAHRLPGRRRFEQRHRKRLGPGRRDLLRARQERQREENQGVESECSGERFPHPLVPSVHRYSFTSFRRATTRRARTRLHDRGDVQAL
jgi:hypothetical protein